MTTLTLEKTPIVRAAVATSGAWLDAIAAVAPAVSKRPPVPILATVKVFTKDSGLYLEGFDYSVSATRFIDTTSVDVEPFLVPYQWLATTLKTVAGKNKTALVGLSKEGDKVVLRCDGYEIPVEQKADVNEFPAMPVVGDVVAALDGTKHLKDAMARVAISASTDDTLPILTAIQMKFTRAGLDMCSTDRYRLGYDYVPAEVSKERNFLFPSKTWAAIAKHLDAGYVAFRAVVDDSYDTYLAIESGDTVYTVYGIDGDYPKIATLIGSGHSTVVELDRAKLLAVTTVASKLTERNCPGSVMISSTGAMVVADPDAKSPEAKADWIKGEPSEGWIVAFNPAYLLDMIKSFTTDTIRFSQDSRPKPAVFTEGGLEAEDGNTFRHMIMPVRLPA